MGTKEIQQEALELSKKFGFISKSVFWDFYCPPGKSMRYQNWGHLTNSPLFTSYTTGSGVPEHLSLSSKGRQLMGQDSIGQVAPTYFTHDEMVMRFFLHLKKESLLRRSWSEGELKSDRALAVKGLGDGVISKLPDLLFDVTGGNDFIRCALEIERTRKSQGRYKTMRRAYQRALNVDLILFGVADEKIEAVIMKEFVEGGVNTVSKEIGFFDLSEFSERNLESELRIGGKKSTLKRFFSSLAGAVQRAPENNRKASGGG